MLPKITFEQGRRMRKPLLVSGVNLSTGLIALGANLDSAAGSPENTVSVALIALACTRDVALKAVSRFFVTPADPPGSGPDYINAAAVLGTMLAPAELLSLLHRIEADLGRRREGRWGPRAIDLDLIAFGDQVLPDAATQTRWRDLPPADQQRLTPDGLILPHPRLQDRAFVLGPLAEIAPQWRHPLTGRTVAAMWAELPKAAREGVRPLACAPGPGSERG